MEIGQKIIAKHLLNTAITLVKRTGQPLERTIKVTLESEDLGDLVGRTLTVLDHHLLQ